MNENAEKNIGMAWELLQTNVQYYNGGQTRREYEPSDNKVAQAQVHALLAIAELLAELANKEH